MRRIEDEAKRMGVLVEDLLTLARLDEAPSPQRQAVDLAALAHDAVEDARATAPERSITLAADRPAIVRADVHQLRQVLANLLGNALVHTPAGTPIEIRVDQDDQGVTVAVRDHGPGLPETPPRRLFDRFWRAEGGRERGKAGAGLGLAIVGGVIQAHGGEVTAENAPGGGARFVVRLAKVQAFDRPADGAIGADDATAAHDPASAPAGHDASHAPQGPADDPASAPDEPDPNRAPQGHR
jgi:two-component system OmpR family sensor kinase